MIKAPGLQRAGDQTSSKKEFDPIEEGEGYYEEFEIL